jgi:hypothetical protein
MVPVVDSVLLMTFLISMTSFGWYGSGSQALVNAVSIQNVFQARPLLIRAKDISFEPHSASLRRQAEFNLATADQYLIRVREEMKSRVYKELVNISEHVQYLPDDTFLLPLTKLELDKVLQMEGVHGVAYRLPSAMKMPNDVAAFIASDGSAANDLRGADQSPQTDSVTIHLVIVAHFSSEDLNYFCQDYPPTTCKVQEVTPGKKLAIYTNRGNKGPIMMRCSTHPLVRWLEEVAEVRALNTFASGIIQGDGNSIEQRHAFWEKNLTGDGEIIGAILQ